MFLECVNCFELHGMRVLVGVWLDELKNNSKLRQTIQFSCAQVAAKGFHSLNWKRSFPPLKVQKYLHICPDLIILPINLLQNSKFPPIPNRRFYDIELFLFLLTVLIDCIWTTVKDIIVIGLLVDLVSDRHLWVLHSFSSREESFILSFSILSLV